MSSQYNGPGHSSNTGDTPGPQFIQGQGGAPGQPGSYPQNPNDQPSPPNPYNHPTTQGGYGQPPQGQYGQPPTQGQYGQPPQGQYGQPRPYVHSPSQMPYAPGYAQPYTQVPPPGPRSSVLGVIGFGVVLAATVALSVLAWVLGQALGEYILELVASGAAMNEEELLNDPRTQLWVQSATGTVLGMAAASVAGLAGWIVSIVAAVQKRGTVFAILGIILGVLALGIAYAVFVAGLAPAMERL